MNDIPDNASTPEFPVTLLLQLGHLRLFQDLQPFSQAVSDNR